MVWWVYWSISAAYESTIFPGAASAGGGLPVAMTGLQVRRLGPAGSVAGDLAGRQHEGPGPAVFQDVGQLVRLVLGLTIRNTAPAFSTAKIAHHGLDRIVEVHGHAVAALDAVGRERVGQAVGVASSSAYVRDVPHTSAVLSGRGGPETAQLHAVS